MFSFLWKTSKGTASYTLCWSTPSLEIFNRGPAKNNLPCSQCIIQTNLIKRHPQLQPSVAQRGGPELQLVPLHRRLLHPPHHHHPQVTSSLKMYQYQYQILEIFFTPLTIILLSSCSVLAHVKVVCLDLRFVSNSIFHLSEYWDCNIVRYTARSPPEAGKGLKNGK